MAADLHGSHGGGAELQAAQHRANFHLNDRKSDTDGQQPIFCEVEPQAGRATIGYEKVWTRGANIFIKLQQPLMKFHEKPVIRA